MANESDISNAPDRKPDPCPAAPRQRREILKPLHGLLDGHPKDDATVAQAFEGMDEMFDLIAAGLYTMASMLVGEGEESIRLVETAVANAEVSACHDPERPARAAACALCIAALDSYGSKTTQPAWPRRRASRRLHLHRRRRSGRRRRFQRRTAEHARRARPRPRSGNGSLACPF